MSEKILGFSEISIKDGKRAIRVPVVSLKWLIGWCKKNHYPEFWRHDKVILVKDLLSAAKKQAGK